MTPEELSEAILDTLADYDAKHREASIAYEEFRAIDQELELLKAHILEDISAAQKDGKPIYSNEEKRKAELTKRLYAQHTDTIQRHAAAEKHKRDTVAELERLKEASRVYYVLKMAQNADREYAAASIRLRAAQIDHHSSPVSLPADFPTA